MGARAPLNAFFRAYSNSVFWASDSFTAAQKTTTFPFFSEHNSPLPTIRSIKVRTVLYDQRFEFLSASRMAGAEQGSAFQTSRMIAHSASVRSALFIELMNSSISTVVEMSTAEF